MTAARIRTMIAATGFAVLLAAPAMAQVSQADEQAIARSLAGQGYSDVRIAEDDGEMTVSATRDGETHSFAYDRDEGRLEPVGDDDDDEGRRGDDGRRGPEAGEDDDDGPRDDGRSGPDRGDDGGRGDDNGPGDDDGDDNGGDDSGHGGGDGDDRGEED